MLNGPGYKRAHHGLCSTPAADGGDCLRWQDRISKADMRRLREFGIDTKEGLRQQYIFMELRYKKTNMRYWDSEYKPPYPCFECRSIYNKVFRED